MRDLSGKIRRALKKPPSYIVARLAHEARGGAERHLAPLRDARLTPARLCALLGAQSVDALWERCAARAYPFAPPAAIGRTEFDRLCPGEAERIMAGAEAALARRVDLLGTGPIHLGDPIDWLTDFKVGRTWPPQFCRAIDYANLDAPSDVKIPWEISRLQWLIPAGQAFLLTGEARFAEAARAIVADWIAANPYAWTVNWSCTMEAALRILTLGWLFHVFKHSEAFRDPAFRFALLRSLYLHGDFTERHIERSDVNGNHFTADAAGLVFAGLFFGQGAAPARWLHQGRAELEREVVLQVFPDGVDFEASVPYHRLVCELFLLPAMYASHHGLPISDQMAQRLRAMADFTAAYTDPTGLAPLWGDADDARALPMSQACLRDHRYLVGLIATFLDDDALKARFGGPVAEPFWLLGAGPATALTASAPAEVQPAPTRSQAFPDGGFYVLAGGGDHVFVDCGPLGLAGRGGHGHNDLLSFEAALCGQKLVTDSGCLAYTGSVMDRNLFRSTAYHNTPQVDGQEINRFVRPDYLWNLHNDAEPRVLRWSPGPDRSELVVSHTGFERLPAGVTPIRTLILDHRDHALTVIDRFEGSGEHDITIPLHLSTGVTADAETETETETGGSAGREWLLRTPGGAFRLTWQATDDWHLDVTPCRIAETYGVTTMSTRLAWRYRGPVPIEFTMRISPEACR